MQQESKRNAYHCLKVLLIEHPRKVLIVIHDQLDHCKFVSHYFVSKNKETNMFIKLPLFVKCMMAHGHRDERYAHYV